MSRGMQSTQCGRYLVWVCGDRIASRGMEDFACRVSLPACLPTKFTQSRESAGASPGGFVRYGLGCSGAGADGGTWRDPHPSLELPSGAPSRWRRIRRRAQPGVLLDGGRLAPLLLEPSGTRAGAPPTPPRQRPRTPLSQPPRV